MLPAAAALPSAWSSLPSASDATLGDPANRPRENFPGRSVNESDQGSSRDLQGSERRRLAQNIARAKRLDEALGELLNDRDFEAQPDVADLAGKT